MELCTAKAGIGIRRVMTGLQRRLCNYRKGDDLYNKKITAENHDVNSYKTFYYT